MNKIVDSIGNVTGAAGVTEAWRDFPGVEGKTYLDVAARGLMPRPTRDALAAHLDEFAAGEVDKHGYFDMIERGIRQGADQKFAWYAAFGLTVTLVWLYLEILRLLSYLRE